MCYQNRTTSKATDRRDAVSPLRGVARVYRLSADYCHKKADATHNKGDRVQRLRLAQSWLQMIGLRKPLTPQAFDASRRPGSIEGVALKPASVRGLLSLLVDRPRPEHDRDLIRGRRARDGRGAEPASPSVSRPGAPVWFTGLPEACLVLPATR